MIAVSWLEATNDVFSIEFPKQVPDRLQTYIDQLKVKADGIKKSMGIAMNQVAMPYTQNQPEMRESDKMELPQEVEENASKPTIMYDAEPQVNAYLEEERITETTENLALTGFNSYASVFSKF